MEPYRPLYALNEPPVASEPSELRGLAFLLIVLGLLRVTPAIVAFEPMTRELAVAVIMLVAGILIATDLPRRLRRLWSRRRIRSKLSRS